MLQPIKKDGYYIASNLLSKYEFLEIKKNFNKLLENEVPKNNSIRIFNLLNPHVDKNQNFRRLITNKKIINRWKSILGEDMVCSSFHSNTTLSGFDREKFHKDYPYWTINSVPKEILSGQTIICLDDLTKENGLKILKESQFSSNWNGNIISSTSRIITAKAGSLIFLHGGLVHSPAQNKTNHKRSCLLMIFQRGYIIPMEDMRKQLSQLGNPTSEETQILCGNQWVSSSKRIKRHFGF